MELAGIHCLCAVTPYVLKTFNILKNLVKNQLILMIFVRDLCGNLTPDKPADLICLVFTVTALSLLRLRIISIPQLLHLLLYHIHIKSVINIAECCKDRL